MLEEIKQLKERSRRQDKVIDELINKNMHHEREESTKVQMSFTDTMLQNLSQIYFVNWLIIFRMTITNFRII